MGDVREDLALDKVNKAIEAANKYEHLGEPFYVVYTQKEDPNLRGKRINGKYCAGGARDRYFVTLWRPQPILNQLVWYVDHKKGEFTFLPELSAPQDIPLLPGMLSDRKEDQFTSVMEKGKQMKVLVS